MDLNQVLANAVRQAHEPGGRAVGSPKVPGHVQEPVTISATWWGPNAVYVRVLREGQTTATRWIPWVGSTAPVTTSPGNKATLVKPLGNLNVGWVQPRTLAPA